MNAINGRVKTVYPADGISEVEVETPILNLYSVILEEKGFLEEGKEVRCVFKESDLVLLKEKVSLINLFEGVVKKIEEGECLSLVYVDCEGFEIKALLSKRELKALSLKEGDFVFLFVSPIHIALEVLDG